jgi:cell division control protein 7
MLKIIGENGIKKYMKSLFTSLEIIHSLDMIHRDVKPANFLYCPNEDSFSLIDFGLSEIEKNVEIKEKNINFPNVNRAG